MSIDRVLKFELSRLNIHLPEERISLKDAFSSRRPGVRVRDGGVHTFRRDELEYLAKVVPEDEWEKLRLPILIALDPKLGRGAARVSGELEVKTICQILNKRAEGGELVIYRPEVAIARRKLPTTTQYFFIPG